MICPECRTTLGRLQQECPSCGWERPQRAPTRSPASQSLSKLDWREVLKRNAMQMANFEAQHFHLTPQALGESDEDFCCRINRDKTPKVVARLERGSDDGI